MKSTLKPTKFQINMSTLTHTDLTQLTEIFACTRCKSSLEHNDSHLVCEKCNHRIPIIDGIPRFIELEGGDLDVNDPIQHRQNYEHQYQTAEMARNYNASFETIPRDKAKTIREHKILNTLLSSIPEYDTILDIPCGGGRLAPPMAKKAKILLEMDASAEQVKLALSNEKHQTPMLGASASALALPFKDGSVDGILNARLSHHLPSSEERAKLLDELLRVSKHFLIFSFRDRASTHTLYRRLRNKKHNPASMQVSEIKSAAERNGAVVEKIMTVFKIGSRHRFALIKKY